jgi:outer membrane protein OmpA-like peptidoglycan-associated protein
MFRLQKIIALIGFLPVIFPATAQTITLYPQADHVGEHTVRMLKIDITDKYTVVSLVHKADHPMGWIRIQPEVQLIAVGGRKKYKFIKAEGIPVAPRQKENIQTGEKTYFKVYFEKLDPGVELFDFFECISNDQVRCFNYYGVHVKNPDIQTKKDEPLVKNEPDPIKKPDNNKPQPPKPVITNPLVTVAGKVIDAKTQKTISAAISYKILTTQKPVGIVNANNAGYKITLAPQKVYTYTASAKGYLAVEESLDLSKATDKQVVTKNILLKPIEVGETIRLNNIYFAQGEYYLLSSSFGELDNLVKIMKDNPTMEIMLEGHTDVIGKADDNLKLSEDRVAEVKNYLIKKGISGLRIQTKAYGGTKPLDPNGNENNRRVEFKILKG